MKQIHEFKQYKLEQRKISMVTCYDFWSARIVQESTIDCVLVGDSLGMVMQGFPTTLPVTMDHMMTYASAVSRGLSGKFLVVDMPFLSFRKSLSEAVESAGRLMQAGANAVKLEGAKGNTELVRHLVDSGIPVMGHLGLTPQSVHQLGGFKVQGKTAAGYQEILNDAKVLEAAGCFAVVLECVPAALAAEISHTLSIPTIGIGAGLGCDGQVLVLQDLLGLQNEFKPKFVRSFLNGFEILKNALNEYDEETKQKTFPTESESYL